MPPRSSCGLWVSQSSPGKSGGLNGSTQHSPEVLSAGVLMAKFVRERRFKKNTALFRSNRVQPKGSGLFEKLYRMNRLERCCVDRLSWQRLTENLVLEREAAKPVIPSLPQPRQLCPYIWQFLSRFPAQIDGQIRFFGNCVLACHPHRQIDLVEDISQLFLGETNRDHYVAAVASRTPECVLIVSADCLW